MTAGMSDILICQRALADIGTRSSISGLDLASFPDALNEFGTEAAYCSLYYIGVRDHILRAANWNFAKRTAGLQLWKALPGTPENPTPAVVSGWSNTYPAPPWVYSYMLPADCIRAHSLIGQPQQVPIAPPIFSGSQGTNPPISQRLPMARFEVATDSFDQMGQQVSQTYGLQDPLTIDNPGAGYVIGDQVTLWGTAQGVPAGIPAIIRVTGTSASTVTSATTIRPGTYLTSPLELGQVSTTGGGTGVAVTGTPTLNPPWQTVILTNQEFALLNYTSNSPTEATWDAMFEEAMVAAMAARLAQSLTGDKALARDKYGIANNIIINARVTDGNEGLTINDHMPDWMRTRGAGGALGYEAFFYPLGPLFPVAPLV